MKLNNNDDSHNSGLNLLIYNMLLDIESHPTWVCGLKHQGVPITTVQKLLGHTSVKTTEIYSEVFDETIIKDLTRANQKYSKSRNVKQNQIKSQKSPGKYIRQ